MDCKCFISYEKVNIDPFRSEPRQVLMVNLQLIEKRIPLLENYFVSIFMEKGKMDAERNQMRLYNTVYYKPNFICFRYPLSL